MDDRQFNGMWNESIPLHLTDASGNETGFYNSGGRGDNDGIVRMFTFNPFKPATAAPVKLVIEVPTGMQEIQIPFELVNLPMP